MLPAEGLQCSSLGHVPYANGLVFTIGEDQLLTRMENGGRDIVVVSSTSIHFPTFCFYRRIKEEHKTDVPLILHNFTWRSSAPDTINGRFG